jgi:hypothetical protein
MKIAWSLCATIYFISATLLCCLTLTQAQYQQGSEARRRTYAYRNYLQQYLYTRRSNPPYFTTPKPKQEFEVPRARSTSKTTRRTTTTTTPKPVVISPANRLAKIIEKTGGKCGARSSNYLPHAKRAQKSPKGVQQPRRGRVVWDDDDSKGASPAPRGTFPWMVSLFVLLKNGEALFMCAGTLLTPNIAVTAAHCFTNNEKQTTW